MKLNDIWNKIKSNKGKLGAALLTAVIGANVLEFNPTIKSGISEAKGVVKKVTDDIFPAKEMLPTKEDMTASEFVGVTVYLDDVRHRLVLSIEERDKLLGISDNLAYIKRDGGAQQVDILLMLDCEKKFGDKEDLYQRCLDMVFEDFDNVVE